MGNKTHKYNREITCDSPWDIACNVPVHLFSNNVRLSTAYVSRKIFLFFKNPSWVKFLRMAEKSFSKTIQKQLRSATHAQLGVFSATHAQLGVLSSSGNLARYPWVVYPKGYVRLFHRIPVKSLQIYFIHCLPFPSLSILCSTSSSTTIFAPFPHSLTMRYQSTLYSAIPTPAMPAV